ncbi:NAD(P)-binding domain [Plasmopara halstedii]|uniref:NAD(P)-binding domain n=1 Tax=Plasmopara halstedii TaxID=4781 RepID=A0A0P1A7G2_PLAHL|nr:NAD(P)-binding domain [Plasmopara halstedii]CEG36145.1 NAD(P)-binding domain [Plasmopara halstedii]|eukprot:XP_024572514.1 NAD(P)-binding domain [Plasmopara halstedii]
MLPRVGVVYTRKSELSLEYKQLAQYIALCLAASGRCAKTWLIGAAKHDKYKGSDKSKSDTDALALRCDGVVLDSSKISADTFEATVDLKTLHECDLWLLMVEADETLKVAEYLHKMFGNSCENRPKRVVLSIQTTMRRLAQLNIALPEAIVVHGGAAFHVVKDDRGLLRPLSRGCFFVERLSKEKSSAVYALDLLESTGIRVLCRHNIQAMKWGCTMLRTFYYINALTGKSVIDGLRDRKTRFLFLQVLVEMDELFQIVASAATVNKSKSGRVSIPDTSAATLFPVQSLMVLLPLPDWIFNSFVIKAFDLGLVVPSSDYKSVMTSDLMACPPLQTNFEAELRDVFELAAGRSMTLPALEKLQQTFSSAKMRQQQEKKADSDSAYQVRIDSGVLLAAVKLSPNCTTASRTFFLKCFFTFVLTLLLALYLFVM